MPTSVLTGTPIPASSASPNVPSDLANVVNGLEDNAVPYYATSGARDTAFSNWVSAGNTMRDGLHCYVQGTGLMQYVGSTWVPIIKTLYRRVVATASGTLSSTSVNLCPGQSIPAAPFGQGVPYCIDVDAVCHASSVPNGAGMKLEISFDSVVQDGDSYTNTASAAEHTSHARGVLTVADNSAHTVTAVVTAVSGTLVIDTNYSRLILTIRPYVTF